MPLCLVRAVPLLKTHLNPSASSRPCTVATIDHQNIPKNTTWFRIRSADATFPMPEPMGQIGASSTGLWFPRREGAISPATCYMMDVLVVYVCIHTRLIMHVRIIVHARDTRTHARTHSRTHLKVIKTPNSLFSGRGCLMLATCQLFALVICPGPKLRTDLSWRCDNVCAYFASFVLTFPFSLLPTPLLPSIWQAWTDRSDLEDANQSAR